MSSAATSHRGDHLAEISISLVQGELVGEIAVDSERGYGVGGGNGYGGSGDGYGGAALPPLLLRGPAAVMLRWHAALSSTCSLLQDVGGPRQWSSSRTFAPLEAEAVEQQLNSLFDTSFELCAHDTQGALAEMSGPLWGVCAQRLRDARGAMPPRPDVFSREAEGIHRRFYSMLHALLVHPHAPACWPGSGGAGRPRPEATRRPLALPRVHGGPLALPRVHGGSLARAAWPPQCSPGAPPRSPAKVVDSSAPDQI